MNDQPSTITPAPLPAEQLPTGAQLQLLIDAFLADLDAVHARESKQLLEQLHDAWRQANLRLGVTREELTKSRQTLQQAFSGLELKPQPTPTQCAGLVAAVETELTRLFHQVRPETDRRLWELSPRHNSLPDFVERLHAGYRQAAQGLPDLSTPTPQQPPAGANDSLWEQAASQAQRLASELRHSAEQNLHLTPRRLVEDLLDLLPQPAAHPVSERYQQAYATLLEYSADSWRALHFQVETALEELRQAADPTLLAAETATSSATRLLHLGEQFDQALSDGDSQLAKALVPITTFLDGVEIDLKLYHRDVVSQLQHALADVDSWETISHHTVRRSVQRVRKLLSEGKTLLTHGRSELERWREPRPAAGRRENAALLTLTDLPTTTAIQNAADALPPLYQRLFLLGPLKNREFLVQCDTALEELEETLARWEAGQVASVALIGAPGSGRRSLLNCFIGAAAHRGAILRLAPAQRLTSTGELLELLAAALQLNDPPASLRQLITAWLAGPRRIVAFEGVHRLALRTVGGTAAVQALMQLIVATQRHTLWIVTGETYPWQRLDYLLEIGCCFTHRIDTTIAHSSALREAIMLRHRTAGIALAFPSGKEAGSGGPRQDGESRYFEQLFAISGGQLDAAIHWWLHSLSYDPDAQQLTVSELPELPAQALAHLNHQQLLALAEIVSHGGLTLEEYCLVFRQAPDPAQLLLDTLRQFNLLECTAADDGRYTVNPLLAEPVAQALRSINLLY